MCHHLKIFDVDPWLERYSNEIELRFDKYMHLCDRVENIDKASSRHREMGFVYDSQHSGWWFREWLPEAFGVWIFGDFNGWNRGQLPLYKRDDGVWEIFLSDKSFGNIGHNTQYKLFIQGANGARDRISAWSRYVVQNDESKDFCAQIWNPEIEFDWEDDYKFKLDRSQGLFIYECHPGMATEQERVGTWSEFTEDVLLRIKSLGYNAIQLMAVAEHPYYGSFGYHVSNFFAPSSRFGTPDDLKMLVKQAHKHKIGVIMDLVHSHFVANLNEGLNELDGSDHHYCKSSPRGDHPYWGSKLFDYSKSEVVSFLLSNLRYWLEEFHFDGFRFDGVTSMLYTHHGYTEFDNPDKYFDCNSDLDAQAYLTLANRVIHMIKPDAVTIAEDVSGMPGITLPSEEGGLGFDYRLGMSLPDYWAKIIDDKISQIDVWQLWNVANNRLSYVPTVAYAESHDQAMVGGKTLSFRLMDSSMYSSMNRAQQNATIERGIALHKMIRLFTILTAGEAYLNFMGNEFGHPEWIDFPRAENDWSYRYARRQWSLVDNPFLRYSYLREFDKDMIALVKFGRVMSAGRAELYSCDTLNSTLVFERGSYLFVFNWSNQTIYDYVINVKQEGVYQIMMSTEDVRYGGVLENVNTECYYSRKNDEQIYIQIKNVAQSAIVLKRES